MNLAEITAGLSGGILVLLTLVEIAPIKLNPWSVLGRAIGRAINSEVLRELEEVRAAQKASQQRLDEHIRSSETFEADTHRRRILSFNNELLRGLPHTREDFIDILAEIDAYNGYCELHPDYPNQRAEHAIHNIGRVYDERLKMRDFL